MNINLLVIDALNESYMNSLNASKPKPKPVSNFKMNAAAAGAGVVGLGMMHSLSRGASRLAHANKTISSSPDARRAIASAWLKAHAAKQRLLGR